MGFRVVLTIWLLNIACNAVFCDETASAPPEAVNETTVFESVTVTISESTVIADQTTVPALETSSFIPSTTPSSATDPTGTKSNVCNSTDCIKTSTNLRKTMDLTVNPCDNFYKFVCGNFKKAFAAEGEKGGTTDWFSLRLEEIVYEIQDFLCKNLTDIESGAVRKAQSLYSSCVDVDKINAKGARLIENVLGQVNLPVKPQDQSKPRVNIHDWTEIAGNIEKTLGLSVFFSVGVGHDPEDRSIKRITIRKPSEDPDDVLDHKNRLIYFKHSHNTNEDFGSTKEKHPLFLNYAEATVQLLSNSGANEIDTSNATQFAADIFEYTLKKAQLTSKYAHSKSNPEVMSLKDLQLLTDNFVVRLDGRPVVNWTSYLHTVFSDVHGYDLSFGNGTTTIVVYDLEYIKETISLIADMSETKIEEVLWWEVVNHFAPHANEKLRKLRNKINVNEEKTEDKREFYCSKKVARRMSLAISYYLVNDPKFAIMRNKVIEMVDNVQYAFDEILQHAPWIDNITRVEALEKERLMEAAYIAYPTWLANYTMIDEQYSWMEDLPDYLDNELQYLKRTSKSGLDNLIIRDNPNDTLVMDPIEVNACYDPENNCVTLPAGVLGYPFYKYGIEAMNYGGIGMVIGHEMTHGFDDSGRKYDKYGKSRDWWENSTETEYEAKAQCFIDAYSKFVVSVKRNKTLNGERTLDENIADNGGFREALYAYRKFVKDNGPEPLLPGFENYNHEQLFTIGMANLQCDASEDDEILYIPWDSHSPGPARVWGIATNSEEFSKIWNCPKGTKMNPDVEKCRVW